MTTYDKLQLLLDESDKALSDELFWQIICLVVVVGSVIAGIVRAFRGHDK